ncbi:MAG: hypothetical protein ACRDY1_12400 [Acidimicrobiales bacterium]
MTTVLDPPSPAPPVPPAPAPTGRDHRGSWIPTGAMVRTRMMELRKRRGLMIAMAVVDIGIPVVFLGIRLILHAAAPRTYGPAGGYDTFRALVAILLYVFGFIVAATLGCTAGSSDLTDGMFRHLVVTGRSRVALYAARIPAGLAIVWTMLGVGFAVVCAVCVFAAPASINVNGADVPAGLSLAGFENWAAAHPDVALCDLPYPGPPDLMVACGPNGPISVGVGGPGSATAPGVTTVPPAAQIRAAAIQAALHTYGDYKRRFLYPSDGLMIRSGLWVELEATVGFMVGLGLGSLLGQRTVSVVLMIVLELILTPIFSRSDIPHLINGQRAVVGLAVAHLEPSGLGYVFGGGGGPNGNVGTSLLVPETRTVAVCVVAAWLVGWTILGAWRMARRDA